MWCDRSIFPTECLLEWSLFSIILYFQWQSISNLFSNCGKVWRKLSWRLFHYLRLLVTMPQSNWKKSRICLCSVSSIWILSTLVEHLIDFSLQLTLFPMLHLWLVQKNVVTNCPDCNLKWSSGNTNSYSISHDNWCTVGGDGGCRVGEVRACTTSPMPDHKGFNLQ